MAPARYLDCCTPFSTCICYMLLLLKGQILWLVMFPVGFFLLFFLFRFAFEQSANCVLMLSVARLEVAAVL